MVHGIRSRRVCDSWVNRTGQLGSSLCHELIRISRITVAQSGGLAIFYSMREGRADRVTNVEYKAAAALQVGKFMHKTVGTNSAFHVSPVS